MSTNIYVGNLPYPASEEQLQHLFGAYGTVERVNLITDRETGHLKGFGFVEMSSGAQEAMSSLNQSEMGGYSLSIRRNLGESAPADPIVGNLMIVVKVHSNDVDLALHLLKSGCRNPAYS